MLQESAHVAQVSGDYFRRFFVDTVLELVVWYESDRTPLHGFQLSYDPEGEPRVITWTPAKGLVHSRLDLGEDSPFANRSPVLWPSEDYDSAALLAAFHAAAKKLGRIEILFVESKLSHFPARK